MTNTPEHPPTNDEKGSSEDLDTSDIEQTELQDETPPGEPSSEDTSSSPPLEQHGSSAGSLSDRVQSFWMEHKKAIIAGFALAAGALLLLSRRNSESDSSDYEDAELSDDEEIDDDDYDLFSTEDDVSSEVSNSDEQIRRKSPRGHTVNGYTKSQPYGPGHSLRRPQEIAPYQRGGEREN